jgi:hypothetical protein
MMPKVDDSEAIVVGGVEGVVGVECGTQEQGQSNAVVGGAGGYE